jgi:phage gp16-like protein
MGILQGVNGMTPAQKKWIQVLHVAKRECGLDDEAYRAVLAGACGVESAGDIKTWEQYNAALTAFKALGFRVKSKTSRATGLKETDTQIKRNTAWVTARQEYYIRGLWDLASRKKNLASLRKMIYRIGGVSDIRFLKRTDAQKVILALRDITEKAGFNPDEPEKAG